jgi:hypothetical protein
MKIHPAVTVVVATHSPERWHTLVRAVASARSQTVSPAEVVVVVDHNPTFFRRIRRDLAGITVLESSNRPGLEGARNTGAFHAQTSLIAFLDDDTVADPHWLAHLLPSFQDPEVTGAAAAKSYDWQSSRPDWLPDEFRWAAGSTETHGRQPAGTVLRREPFRQAGGFASDTDTDFPVRLSALTGGRWAYVPEATLRRLVPPGTVTFGSFLRRCYDEGRSRTQVSAVLLTAGRAGVSRRTDAAVSLRGTNPVSLHGSGGVALRGSDSGRVRSAAGRAVLRAVGRDVVGAVRHRDVGRFRRAGGLLAGVAALGIGAMAGSVRVDRVPRRVLAPAR